MERAAVAEMEAVEDVKLVIHRAQRGDYRGDDDDQTHVSRLPVELLTYIYQMLPVTAKTRCSQVCKEWNELSRSPMVWRNQVIPWSRRCFPGHAPWLRNAFRRLGVLRAVLVVREEYHHYAISRLMIHLADCIPNMQSLRFELDDLSCHTFVEYNQWQASMTQLTVLAIVKTEPSLVDDVIPACVRAISEHLVNLVRLDMRGFEFGSQELLFFSRGLGELTHLTLDNCVNVDDVGFGHLAGRGAAGDFVCPKLLCLKLLVLPLITGAAMRHLREGQPALRNLTLRTARLVDDQGTNNLPLLVNLETLRLQGDFNDIHSFFGNMVPVQRLRVLHVEDCRAVTDADVQGLAAVVQLRDLAVSRMIGIRDSSWGFLARLTHLTDLSVCRSNLNDDGLRYLADAGSRVCRLVLMICPVTDDGFRHVARLPALRCLTLIRLWERNTGKRVVARRVLGCGIRHLATTAITRLDLSCTEWSCPLLMMHVSRMTRLDTLVLSVGYVVVEEDVQLLEESLPILGVRRSSTMLELFKE